MLTLSIKVRDRKTLILIRGVQVSSTRQSIPFPVFRQSRLNALVLLMLWSPCGMESRQSEKLRRWGFDQEDDRIPVNAADIHELYDQLIRLCYLTPLMVKMIALILFIYRLWSLIGQAWVRRWFQRDIYNSVANKNNKGLEHGKLLWTTTDLTWSERASNVTWRFASNYSYQNMWLAPSESYWRFCA